MVKLAVSSKFGHVKFEGTASFRGGLPLVGKLSGA